jgi:hypothetical protein
MENSIKIFKLMNGEELIAEEVDPGFAPPSHIVVKNIMKIVIIPGRASPNAITKPVIPSIGLAPWTSAFSSQETFRLDRSHITCIMDPVKEFVDEYKQSVSPIAQVKPPGLIV